MQDGQSDITPRASCVGVTIGAALESMSKLVELASSFPSRFDSALFKMEYARREEE